MSEKRTRRDVVFELKGLVGIVYGTDDSLDIEGTVEQADAARVCELIAEYFSLPVDPNA